MEKPLINKVANSSLVNLNLENYFPKTEIVSFDLKDYLFHGLILKEKDFRAALKEYDWSTVESKILHVYCSTDAIIPVWAFMLVSAYAQPYAENVFLGTKEEFLSHHYRKVIESTDFSEYEGQRIVIKGCSQKPVPASAYLTLTAKLRPYAQSIMYGEPCSTVPIFKKPRKLKEKT
jgi:hypothetical protein